MIRRRKRADGSTAYDVSLGGRDGKTFDRYDDAEDYEIQLKRRRRRTGAGLDEMKPNITFEELVELWKTNFDPSRWRLDMIAYSTAKWGRVRIRDLQPELIGAWIHTVTGQNGRELSEKTRSHILETLRQVLNAAVEWGYLTKSPARPRAFKAPKKKSRVRPILPFESWEEVERVIDAMPRVTDRAFVQFCCATGVRPPGEVVDLMWPEIDLKGKTMRVGSKTDAGHRTVPLSYAALTALAWLPRDISGRVFVGKNGGRFDYQNWRKNEWRAALETAGLTRRTPYEMRHTFATLALSHGAAIDDVSTVLGHEDISITYAYYRKWIKTMADRLRLTLDQIGAEPDGRLGRSTQ